MRALLRNASVTVLCFGISLSAGSAIAQTYSNPAQTTPEASAALPLRYAASLSIPGQRAAGIEESSPAGRAPPSAQDIQFRTRIFVAGSVLGVGAYGALKWWNRGLSSDFRTRSEGWFGADTQKGGADKLGHAFGNYTGLRAGTHYLQLLGNSHDDALRIATVTSTAVYLGIEVLDGFTKTYRFSYVDVIANVVGAGFGWLIETNPALDALVDFRLAYRQSPEAKAEGNWAPFDDYNGQKYLLAFKASGVPALEATPIVRYAELVVGYGVRGYDPPGAARSRHVYAGVALNVSRLLDDTIFRHKRDSLLRKETGLFLELFQLPGTAVLANHAL